MDVLKKELNAIYNGQNLIVEKLDYEILDKCKYKTETAVAIDNDCRVITDAAADKCYIFGGKLAHLIGLCDTLSYAREMNSGDEDMIYNRIHPEDLVDKRMLEYDFLKYIDTLHPDEKLNYKATCHFRIKDRNGRYIYVDNTTRIMHLSPYGKIWLILCCYNLSPYQEFISGITSRIINDATGEIIEIKLSVKRANILTKREKEILNLIKEGKLSKQIASILGISVHTVNRHRQNILEKLSVGNSVEAITAAALMKIL